MTDPKSVIHTALWENDRVTLASTGIQNVSGVVAVDGTVVLDASQREAISRAITPEKRVILAYDTHLLPPQFRIQLVKACYGRDGNDEQTDAISREEKPQN